MRILLFPALIVAGSSLSVPAMAHDSGSRSPSVGVAASQAILMNRPATRWVGGHHAPGGWGAYRRPVLGYALPRYWVQPSFSVRNWQAYGLYQPRAGYGWQRYYDDAVLIDRSGRVVDYVPNHNWDRGYRQDYDARDYDDGGEPPRRRSNSVGGALIGGAIGAITGSAVAGRGNRTEGAILGGGVGAIAGAALADRADRRAREEDRRRYDRRPEPRDSNGAWRGRWEGRWIPEGPGDGPVYEGTYRGDYGDVVQWDDEEADYRVTHRGGAHMGSYALPPYATPHVTTIVIQSEPVVTTETTTEYITEVVRTPVRKVARKAAPVKQAKRPTCVCKLVYR